MPAPRAKAVWKQTLLREHVKKVPLQTIAERAGCRVYILSQSAGAVLHRHRSGRAAQWRRRALCHPWRLAVLGGLACRSRASAAILRVQEETLNCSGARGRFSVAIMLDTEGSEVHTSALDQPIKAEVGPPHAPCLQGSQPDTEGSEVHTSALDQHIKAEVGPPNAPCLLQMYAMCREGSGWTPARWSRSRRPSSVLFVPWASHGVHRPTTVMRAAWAAGGTDI